MPTERLKAFSDGVIAINHHVNSSHGTEMTGQPYLALRRSSSATSSALSLNISRLCSSSDACFDRPSRRLRRDRPRSGCRPGSPGGVSPAMARTRPAPRIWSYSKSPGLLRALLFLVLASAGGFNLDRRP